MVREGDAGGDATGDRAAGEELVGGLHDLGGGPVVAHQLDAGDRQVNARQAQLLHHQALVDQRGGGLGRQLHAATG